MSFLVVISPKTFDMELTSNNWTNIWAFSTMGASPMPSKVFRVFEHFVADATYTVASFGLVQADPAEMVSFWYERSARGRSYGDGTCRL